ncbi:uroporphyrinogen-III C-methyltransferase [Cytobacillus firmus]|uniref:uroporphyrinogen-III C-methyltransferase n=1 Tax=Cytobacillus firmus TaxID=1399 RepID=UPI00216283AE|nr:uroporphyrinogen-III C-methyltransferase [Cytobacillus firmus]MCS0671364.1 uroporphyrinogen-III C-methyltransferase [Cytobacillus firmus]
MKKGKVYLVGAGPGDEGLITVKGLTAIQKADVILYDRLINPNLLESAPSQCELIFCGKLPKQHLLKQEIINDILIDKAMKGYNVVRLKGGDPGVFGRVGEEAEALAEHEIPFEIVPGISSGIAVPLYAGIPVTHRAYGISFALVSAHDKSKEGKPDIDWNGLVASVDTIAFYMGVSNISYIADNLILHGKPKETPVILIQWGTYGRQKTLQGTIGDIAEKVKEKGIQNPAITLVGDIVSLRDKLKWFENKPLYGRQILLARTGTARSPLAEQLKEHGADVIEIPKWTKKDVPLNVSILNQLFTYKRILFTSPESANEFIDLLINRNIDIRNVRAELYCLSKKSLKVLKERGLSGRLAAEMNFFGPLLIVGNRSLNVKKIPYIEQDGKHDILQTSETILDESFIPAVRQILTETSLDTIIFPSSSSVDAFMEYGGYYGIEPAALIKKLTIVCMGKSSGQQINEYGYTPDSVLSEPNAFELVKALIQEKVLESIK